MNTHAFGAGDPGAAAIRKQRQADARAAKDKEAAKDSKTK